MKYPVMLVLALAGCTAAIGDMPEHDAGTPPHDDGGGPLTGRELFASSCAVCHGPEGQGSVNAYELQHPNEGFATYVVRTGRPGLEFPGVMMAAYSPELVTDAQLDEIWTWLDSFPQPTTGEGLYRDYCQNCHGADGMTGPAAQELREKTAYEMIEKVREGEGGTNYALRQAYMPSFDANRLTDAEITSIAAYIQSL
jgi:mono/diheme cytochrome c family protein